MNCSARPDVTVIWADGRARAWFCNKCFTKWKGSENRDIFKVTPITDLLSESDKNWVEQVALPYLKIGSVSIKEDESYYGTYPDIWINTGTRTITVTRAWAKQSLHERRKRLLHEMLHMTGLRHGPKERKLGYYSRPDRDSYSKKLYQDHLKK